MISEPVNWYPSMFMGDGNDTINATVNNTFSCEVNCTGYIYAYELVIMQNDAGSTQKYTSNPVRLSTAYKPRDNNGNPIKLQITVPSSSTMTNGYANGYKWHLLLWETDAGSSASAATWRAAAHYTTHDYLFYAKANTTVAVNTTGWSQSGGEYAAVTSKSKVFTATYSSPDMIQWFRWNLAIVDPTTNNKSIIYSTDKIYSFDTTFTYDQFITGNKYAIQVEVYNQGGIYQKSAWVVFPVSYDTLQVKGMTSCEMTDHGLEVIWSSACYIQGVAQDSQGNTVQPGTWGQSSYKYGLLQNWPVQGKYSLEMESGVQTVFESNVNYDVEVDTEGCIVLSTMLRPYPVGTRQPVLKIEMDNDVVETLDHMGFVSGLQPSGSLTPSGSLVPSNGEGGLFVFSGVGFGTSQFVTSDEKDFLTSYGEGLTVSDKTTYYKTDSPMTTVYTIVLYKGEISVIEHPLVYVTAANHVTS